MARSTTRFICGQCGYESPKWLGKCPGCQSWNTLTEEVWEKKSSIRNPPVEALRLTSISSEEANRISCGINELDRVLGGGIVPGSLVLLGGDPGVGKSTLLLQVANHLAACGRSVLYLSGEESLKQIRLRSIRLDMEEELLYLLNEPDIDLLDYYLDQTAPALLIIDSIQTVYSGSIPSIPGTVNQLRECTLKIAEHAKKRDIAAFIVGHVTKDGALAGPRTLEHMVDAVVYFEGDRDLSLRLLRSVKNRFGSTDEIGLMEMSGKGLVEVPDPSSIFLASRGRPSAGTAVAACFEGSRSFLVEVQALVSQSGSGYPRRMASGIDQNRLALLIAVLEKRCGFRLSAYDIYLKVTGGLFIKDPAVDLGIAAAIISSLSDYTLDSEMVFIGEISLSGFIRPVQCLDQRLRESEKMGYSRIIIPPRNNRTFETDKLQLLTMESVEKLLDLLEG